MSFEGHYQILCARGHAGTIICSPCYAQENKDFADYRCRDRIDGEPCGALVDWENLVDTTNGDEEGHKELIERTPREMKACDLGHLHVWNHPTYVRPD